MYRFSYLLVNKVDQFFPKHDVLPFEFLVSGRAIGKDHVTPDHLDNSLCLFMLDLVFVPLHCLLFTLNFITSYLCFDN